MRKALCFLLVLALAACAGTGGTGTQSNVQTLPMTADRTAENVAGTAVIGAASVAWNVGTGASTYSYALQDLDFFPNTITIDAGDTITYHVASGAGGDVHTISFVPPGQPIPSPGDPNNVVPTGGTTVDGTHFLNSGILFGGQTFTLHFPRAGRYQILCLFHEPAMESTVVVQPPGTPYPHNAFYYVHTSNIDLWEDLGAAQRSLASFPFRNGGTTLAAGIDPGLTSRPPSDSTVLRYLDNNDTSARALQTAGDITIRAGTILTWVNETSNEPHTVTIVRGGVSTMPNLPPDPAFGGHIFDGTKTINSGTFIGGQSFWAKFTKPGKYLYGCLYHDNSRMTAWVTVTP